MKFSVISCGWNCDRYIDDWLKSLKAQNVDWEAFVMDDGSTDHTSLKLSRIKDSRIHSFKNERNYGAAFSRWELLKHVSRDSVVVQLDLDDWLINSALEKVQPHYENGKLMTVGSFTVNKGQFRPSIFYSRQQIDENTFHLDKLFKCPPLRTFHGSLISLYRPDDFKLENKWLRACTDVALMWPLLRELKYDQIGFVKETIYMYRRRLRQNTSGGKVHKGPLLNELRKRYE